MVRKIGQLLLIWGRWLPPAPSLCLILGPRRKVRSENFFHDSREKLEKPVEGGPLAIGGLIFHLITVVVLLNGLMDSWTPGLLDS